MNKIFTSLTLGINSGLAYALNVMLYTAYLKDNDISLISIGMLALTNLPYSFKYLWSPVFDNIKLTIFSKTFGQRKSWIIITQVLLIASIISLCFINVKQHFYVFCLISFLTSFFAASYDIVSQAFRIELSDKDLKKISFYNTVGFRIGFVICGPGGLYLSSLVSWSIVFLAVAASILPCIFIVANSKDNKRITHKFNALSIKEWLKKGFLEPILVLLKQEYFYLILLVISFYKISDGYLDKMLIPFLEEIGYTKPQLSIGQTIGTVATLLGTVAGSFFTGRISIIKCLFVAEILSAFTNLLFVSLVYFDNSMHLYLSILSVENFASGVCNIVLINYMSMLCDKKFTATHFAILVSFSSLSKTLSASSSGIVALKFGWSNFFLISSLLSIPAIICIGLLYKYRKSINVK